MSDFGELILIVGDSFLPTRALAIPEKFEKMLVPKKMQHVLCTGNLVSKEHYEKLRLLAPNFHAVKGDFDLMENLPESKIVNIGQFKIGLIHGHQIIPWGDRDSLIALQRKMNVDILITGHTHKYEIFSANGKWFVNPGSITGAYSDHTSEIVPSFVLMAIQGNKIVAYVYELKGEDNVVVSKTEINKENH